MQNGSIIGSAAAGFTAAFARPAAASMDRPALKLGGLLLLIGP